MPNGVAGSMVVTVGEVDGDGVQVEQFVGEWTVAAAGEGGKQERSGRFVRALAETGVGLAKVEEIEEIVWRN